MGDLLNREERAAAWLTTLSDQGFLSTLREQKTPDSRVLAPYQEPRKQLASVPGSDLQLRLSDALTFWRVRIALDAACTRQPEG
jgi:hypothetical protein